MTGYAEEEWNENGDYFDEETLQLSGWARGEWARKYAPIPALKGVHTTTQNAKLVLSAVAGYSNPDYSGAWPGIDRIRGETGLSKRAVQYALRALECLGLIEEMPLLGKQCPKYMAIPADKRPAFYHVYFVFDSRYITPTFTEWAESRLAELREKYAEQRRAGCNRVPSGVQPGTERGATGYETGCNRVPSGVQRVAPKTSTKHLEKTLTDKRRETTPTTANAGDGGDPDNNREAAFEDNPSDALDALSTDPDRLRFEQLADTNPELRRLRDEFEMLRRGQTGNGSPSQWAQRFTG